MVCESDSQPPSRRLVGGALPITLLVIAFSLLTCIICRTEDHRVWTWSLHSDVMPVLLPNDDRWLLTLDCLFSLVYVIAGFAWLGFLRDRAAQISGSDPNRFGPASRRIHQWAGFGAVLVAAAGLADVIENALMFFSLNHSIPDAAVDGMRALAWLKWINLTLGVCFFVAASISALWRLRVERVLDAGKVGNSGDEKVCKDKTHQLPEWSAGRNQRPEEFKPEPDQPRLGICLSGGGIRSASFSLGALQAIQTSKLPIPKYITSVSGGAYMAGAWQSMRSPESSVQPGEHVFAPRSAEERWVRHHTDYLVSSFSVIAGAVGALLGGLVVNLLILLAVASIIVLPLGWAIGLSHPELDARTPILDITDQPEVSVAKVTYSAAVPLPPAKGGNDGLATDGPGYLVSLKPTWGTVRTAPQAADVPTERSLAPCPPGTLCWSILSFLRIRSPQAGLYVTDAVVAESNDGGLEVVRQPSLILGDGIIGEHHTGDQKVPSVVVAAEPSVSIGALEGSSAGPPSVRTEDSVKRAVSIDQQPLLEQHSGTSGREPLSIETWMVVAGVAELLLGGIAWIVTAWPRLARRLQRSKLVADGHDIPSALALGAVWTFLVLVGFPWFIQAVPNAVGNLPSGPAGGSGSAVWLPALLATAAALGRYFQPATKALGGLSGIRGGSRILDALVGAVAFAVALVLLATIGNVAVANGPSGRLAGATGELFNVYLPSWTRWLIALGVLLLGWVCGPSAHAWSLFSVYGGRLNRAYLMQANPGSPSDRSVTPRLKKSWKWTEVGMPSSSSSDPATEWVVCTTANIRGSGEAAPGRAGGSFTFSRSWIGGPEVGWMRTREYLDIAGDLADVDVGSTIAMSGAAFSPAMGKNSVQNQGRLMAVLNLRLGVWVPNPMLLQGRPAAMGLRRKLWTAKWPWYLREFTGFYDRTARFIYLTDGGHWENLGLVELLRRGCCEIWMISAAGDGTSSFETLAQAIALAREELGVEFDLELEPLRSPKKPCRRERRLLRDGESVATAPRSFVTGTFSYPSQTPDGDRIPGKITVIEAALIGDAPWDVHSYAEQNADFPDISTGYQLMDHRDFEAYRMLGFVQTQRALDAAGSSDGAPSTPPVI
jgi:hypothetical protein